MVADVVVRRRLEGDGKCGKANGILKEFEQKCAAAKLKQVADAMTMGMHEGLTSEGGSKLKMIISSVDNLPAGFLSRVNFEKNHADQTKNCKKSYDIRPQ